MRPRPVPESAIFGQIPAQNIPDHTVVGVRLAEHTRFQKQKDALRGVRVGVVLAPDLMNDVMAKGKLAEDPLSARLFLFKFCDLIPNFVCNGQVF